ncbi:VOC family protein [Subtercola lobariae]|uniref:VOC family protein n=2 Tax=Subtercola lobariae TaxID=1588641 RepID=A0A917B1G2_9MICO|nr:VOC family protein [Subtercola lobariae]
MAILNPYLNFRGEARAALDFYQTVFGGEIIRSTFGEFQVSEDPAEADKIMHSQLTSPSGFTLMVSDTPNRMDYTPGNNISVSLSGGAEDLDELAGYFTKLSEGGTVTMPFNTAPWGDSFGMLVDPFGIAWLVNVAGAPAA